MLGILAVIAIVLLVLYFLTGAVLGIGSLIITVIIWAVIGWLAGQIMKGDGYGAVGNILLGVVGGLVGGLIFNLLGLGVGGGLIGAIIVGVVGSIVVIAIGRMIQGRRVA
jgi:uncharacterized membrane protein YeaQ/YmgE (transglycosylase-associated protein family)